MTEFAHTYDSTDKADASLNVNAMFTVVLHGADGKIHMVDSNEASYLKNEQNAIDAAMFSVSDYSERCDVFWYGEYYGTAQYIDMTPNSWFSRMEVVFSMLCD